MMEEPFPAGQLVTSGPQLVIVMSVVAYMILVAKPSLDSVAEVIAVGVEVEDDV
jgi:hypothetical protein